METTYNLRPLWTELLKIYRAFAAVCDRHDLKYYVIGGTLLGAARHKGFIPWDDDFDLIMPRPDYREFFDKYVAELPSYYRGYDFRSFRDDDTFRCMFGKVSETRKDVIARVMKLTSLNLNGGIYIDVIPVDGMPKATIPFYWWALRRSVWRHAMSARGTPFGKCPIWKALSILMRIPADEKARNIRFEEWLMKWNYYRSPAVDDYNSNGRRFKTRALTRESIGEPVYMPFEDLQVPCPREWDKYLRLIYNGDWRILPPPDKRKPSHQVV